MVNKALLIFSCVALEMIAAAMLLLHSPMLVLNATANVDQSTGEQIMRAEQAVVIFESRERIAYCVIGALCGALISVTIFPPKSEETEMVRRLGAKFGCSAIGGIILTPKAISYLDWEPNADNLLVASFLLSTVVVSVLHTVLPVLERKLTGMLKSKIE